MLEEFQELPVTDTANPAPAQGKPRCITVFLIINLYMYVVHLRCRNFMIHTCIYISTYKSY
jgi:phosphoribulokinase